MEGTIGEIRFFAGNFEPRNWCFCEGQLLSIDSNVDLFKVIGNTYGGDGKNTFALPDLRTRVAIGIGQGDSNTDYVIGKVAGEATHQLSVAEMPTHGHYARMMASTKGPSETTPINNYLARSVRGASLPNIYSTAADFVSTTMDEGSTDIGNAGGDKPHNNMQPYLVCNYIICQDGNFPIRPS